MSEERRTTSEEARRVGDEIGVDWERFDLEQFRAVMNVEYEHGSHDPQTDVTGDDPILTGKIALAHMKEFPDYYERLERMEREAERDWAERGKDQMEDVLVLYATTHGHTAKIAVRIAEALQAEHVHTDLREVSEAGAARPLDYDGAILCASLHQGQHQPEMVDWARHHHIALEERPSAFVSVSLTAAEDSDEARQATRDCIDDFLDDTGWTPKRTLPVAGALEYREYDVFTRTLMRLMMKRAGHPTDISHDYDYTDWELVERFGRDFATLVGPTR